ANRFSSEGWVIATPRLLARSICLAGSMDESGWSQFHHDNDDLRVAVSKQGQTWSVNKLEKV
ncbi:MAG: hypothetical protein Q9210_005639, partial [Variospora velana]